MNLISEDYLMHHGVKGMKWGVRHDPERKDKYKAERKAIKSEHKKVWKEYNQTSSETHKIMKAGRQANKRAYKEGKIDKEEYKRYKKSNRRMEYQTAESLEYKMAIAQYKLKKAERANKATYLKDIYGSESRKYKRGMKAYNKKLKIGLIIQ